MTNGAITLIELSDTQSGEKVRGSPEHEFIETCGEWSYSRPVRTHWSKASRRR